MAYANNKQIIADGRITLYQRDDVKDAIWQCRIPFKGVRGYIKRTTGEKDFHKAAVVAIKLLGEIEHRIVTDQPLSPSTFKSVAGEFIKAAKTRMDEGRSSDARAFVDSKIRFPWPSPLGDRMVMGDLCVKAGSNHHVYRDNQANHYLVNHNLASLCTAVAQANRIFDAEAILGKHTIAVPMARAIASIDAVIKEGTLTELNRHQAVFNAVKTVFDDADPDIDRADI